MVAEKDLYIIDCSYHFRASFFALPPIFTRDGRLINAVYGFVSTLFKLLATRSPDAVAIADDAHRGYFRHDLFPKYKSEKKPVPEECNQQMPNLLRVLNAMAIPYLNADGFEADDIIATLTRKALGWNYHIYICSRDKDLRQLLTDNVTILDIVSGKETTLDTVEQQGIHPKQIPDLFALTGDKVDSIPGIPGVGPKTAIRLLNKYQTLENILEHCGEIGGRVGERIRDYHEQALLSKRLATLREDVPIEITPEDCRFKPPDKAVLDPLFRELGLEHLSRRLIGTLGVEGKI